MHVLLVRICAWDDGVRCSLLARACAQTCIPRVSLQVVFKSAAAISGSMYQRLALLAPAVLLGPINLLAHMAPDTSFKQVLEARLMLSAASMALVRQARSTEAQQHAAEAQAAAATAAAADAEATAKVGPAVKASSGSGRARGSIAPGSFLGLLLSARDKAGHGLTDLQMLMQVNVFTLAGVSDAQQPAASAVPGANLGFANSSNRGCFEVLWRRLGAWQAYAVWPTPHAHSPWQAYAVWLIPHAVPVSRHLQVP